MWALPLRCRERLPSEQYSLRHAAAEGSPRSHRGHAYEVPGGLSLAFSGRRLYIEYVICSVISFVPSLSLTLKTAATESGGAAMGDEKTRSGGGQSWPKVGLPKHPKGQSNGVI